MKKFYSFLDSGYVLYCPQPLQHLANSNMAAKSKGTITFYGSEELETLNDSKVLRSQLQKKSEIDGIIFFTINQFRNNEKFNLELLLEILQKNLEVHFSRENISIRNLDELKIIFPLIKFVDFALNRDISPNYRKKVIDNYQKILN